MGLSSLTNRGAKEVTIGHKARAPNRRTRDAVLAMGYVLFVIGASAQTKPSCTYFTVVTQDSLKNIKQGLSPDDTKWFQKTFARKNHIHAIKSG